MELRVEFPNHIPIFIEKSLIQHSLVAYHFYNHIPIFIEKSLIQHSLVAYHFSSWWVNFITTSLSSRSLETMVSKGNHPQMAEQFRLYSDILQFTQIIGVWNISWGLWIELFFSTAKETHFFRRNLRLGKHLQKLCILQPWLKAF